MAIAATGESISGARAISLILNSAPYLHDGNAAELEDVVYIMSRYQLGRTFEKEEVDKVVKFLKTLTGEFKGKKL